MQDLQLWVGGVNATIYRYEIQKVGDIFNVRIFNVIRSRHVEDGVKVLSNVSVSDVIDECQSHYTRKTASICSILNLFRF